MIRATFLLSLAALSTACAAGGPTGAFSPRFADNQREQTAAVVARMPQPSNELQPMNTIGKNLAVGTTVGESRGVVLYDLDAGRALWTHQVDAMTRPEILGDVVITSDREHVVALDLATGEELWQHDLGDTAYMGAAREGNTIVYVLSVGAQGGARRIGNVETVNARTGSYTWYYEIEGVLGRPAIHGGIVFIPWDMQNIALLRVSDGIEIARLRSTDDVIRWCSRPRPASITAHAACTASTRTPRAAPKKAPRTWRRHFRTRRATHS